MSSPATTKRLMWIPRVLSIVFVLFLSLFALDAFSGSAPFLEKLGGFLIHLAPTFVLLAIVVLSWRYPVFGGVALIVAGAVFAFSFDTRMDPVAFLTISLPPIVVGAMFIIFHFVPRDKRRREM